MAIHSVLIGGNRWEFRKLTPKLAVKFLRELKQNPKKVHLRGYCNTEDKKIYIQEKQHPEEYSNTVLHEGLHAIIKEIGGMHGLQGLNAL
jgi:hypothetical protein